MSSLVSLSKSPAGSELNSLPLRLSVSRSVSLSKIPTDNVLNLFLNRFNDVSSVSLSKIPVGKELNSLPLRSSDVRLLKPSKSPDFSAVMFPCVLNQLPPKSAKTEAAITGHIQAGNCREVCLRHMRCSIIFLVHKFSIYHVRQVLIMMNYDLSLVFHLR